MVAVFNPVRNLFYHLGEYFMRMQLLVDSGEFWSALRQDIQLSTDYIYAQTLSLEGDEVGKMFSAELMTSHAEDIRVLVDHYTKYVLSDRFLYTVKNVFDKDLKTEKANTLSMFEKLSRSGVQVKFTNPVGKFFHKFPARNHKKMILIDDHISYIGGINFSDHNFEWHDLMIRIDDPEITAFLKKDFLSTWDGNHVYEVGTFKDIKIYLYDGYSNEETFHALFDIIENAKKSIFVESAYASFPFYKKLRDARKRGVKVVLISPAKNNRKHIGRYTLWEAKRSGIELRLYQHGMTHAKAMLIDDSILIFGSTNFDYVSYRVEQELVAIIKEKSIVNDFKRRVVEVDLENSEKFDSEVNHKKGLIHYITLKVVGKITTFLAKQ